MDLTFTFDKAFEWCRQRHLIIAFVGDDVLILQPVRNAELRQLGIATLLVPAVQQAEQILREEQV